MANVKNEAHYLAIPLDNETDVCNDWVSPAALCNTLEEATNRATELLNVDDIVDKVLIAKVTHIAERKPTISEL